jgi:predicted transcriptional regulator
MKRIIQCHKGIRGKMSQSEVLKFLEQHPHNWYSNNELIDEMQAGRTAVFVATKNLKRRNTVSHKLLKKKKGGMHFYVFKWRADNA